MADYRYSYNGTQKGIAKGVLKDGAISTKVAIEMCNFLRGRNTEAAKAILERILNMEQALPFKRFTDGVGHKKGKGMASGRYPQKASQAFLDLITLVEANAQQKGLSEELIIVHAAAHKASSPYHFGRQSRRQMKRTHLELVLKEDTRKPKKVTTTKVKPQSNAPAKKEAKVEAKIAEKKTDTPAANSVNGKKEKVEVKPVEKAPETKTETKPEIKSEKVEAKVEAKTETEQKPADKTQEAVKGEAQ